MASSWDINKTSLFCAIHAYFLLNRLKTLVLLDHTNPNKKTGKMEGNLKQKLLNKEITSEQEKEDESSLTKKVWKESKLMWIVAAPAIFTRFSTFGLNIISQAFIGHIGPRELAAFALVFTVLIRFANGVLVCTIFYLPSKFLVNIQFWFFAIVTILFFFNFTLKRCFLFHKYYF